MDFVKRKLLLHYHYQGKCGKNSQLFSVEIYLISVEEVSALRGLYSGCDVRVLDQFVCFSK